MSLSELNEPIISFNRRRKIRFSSLIILAVYCVFGIGTGIALEDKAALPELLIDDFDKGATDGVYYKRTNSIGQYQGTWAKRPSYSLISKSDIHRVGDEGLGLVLKYKKEAGWCGWYTRLGNVDATKYNVLSFWVKGKTGGERFDIGFLDKNREQHSMDSVYAGPVNLFLEDGLTTEWRKVKVPLSRVASQVDLERLSAIILWFKQGGQGTIYIDDMKFEVDSAVARIEDANFPKAKKSEKHSRSMWVWKIDPVVNEQARKDLILTCKKTATEVIYLFFGGFDQERDPAYTEKLIAFLRELHSEGIKVELLTGNPTWALQKNHHIAINWLKPFLEFNQGQPPESRFDGVSFDVEPYLSGEWETDKERIKTEYIILLKALRELIDSYPEQNFKFGCAIPIFYIDEGTFEEEILILSDYVALMDYYDTAEDMIKHSDRHLHLAKKLGKKIWIGVENQDLVGMQQGKRRNTFFEEGWEYMEFELEKVKETYSNHPGFGGFAVHCYYSYRQMQKEKMTPQNPLRLEKPGNEIFRVSSFRTRTPIAVDGSLEDWGYSSRHQVLNKDQVVFGQGAWKGTADLSAKFYSQWDEEALYFAFHVNDNVVVQNKSGHEMWEGDHIELWLDVDLGADFIEATNSNDDFQIGLSPGNFGELAAETFIWVPPLKTDRTPEVEIASAKTNSGYVIELRIPLRVLYNNETVPMSLTDVISTEAKSTGKDVRYTQKREGPPPKNFYQGYKLGISAEFSDTDELENPQKCLMSTTLDRTWGDPTTFGFLELVGEFEGSFDSTIMADSDSTGLPTTIAGAAGVGSGVVIDALSSPVTGDEKQRNPEISPAEYEGLKDEVVDTLTDVPGLPPGTKLSSRMLEFAYRGRLGSFQLKPDKAVFEDDFDNYFDPTDNTIANYPTMNLSGTITGSTVVRYDKQNLDLFCGVYLVIMGDISKYKAVRFLIKGKVGGETFEIGINDAVSNMREDAVFVGSIYRYLPNGVTTDWQLVEIPLEDFYGADTERIFSLAFLFNEVSSGMFWIDELRFSDSQITNRDAEIKAQGYLLLDNFDHSDLNLLGRKTATYKKLPSYCVPNRVLDPRYGDSGRSLELKYYQGFTGWSGYYGLLNQIGGAYYDLSAYKSVSFMVKGAAGGEHFEVGMADKNWMIIGDSLKADQVTKYLDKGITTDWQIVQIPLTDFGNLDLTQMGSFVINFNTSGEGAVYIDDLKFNLRK